MNEKQISALAHRGTLSGDKLLQGEVEETHISWVILAERLAFKIKKPVKLSFLDFSTLELRRKLCKKEVLLNRRFSDIYLGVEPVRSSGRDWTIGEGSGKVRDYAVKMKKMDPDRRMDVVAGQRKLLRRDILNLAGIIATFHKKARIIRSYPGGASLQADFNDIGAVAPVVRSKLPRRYSAIVSNAISWSDTFLASHASRFQERIVNGFKRDVHGDLHSGNIFLYKRPVIFDCIEFNDRYRQIDVLNEVAFFCMDLEALGYGALSPVFMKAYCRIFPCFETKDDYRLFAYFKCYRANVRAKVHALAASGEGKWPAQTRHVKAVKQYLLLMEKYISQEREGTGRKETLLFSI